MDIIKICDISGIFEDFEPVELYNYDPIAAQDALRKVENAWLNEMQVNNRIDYRRHWHKMTGVPLTEDYEAQFDVLDELFGSQQTQKVVTFMRLRYPGQQWKPRNLFTYLIKALEGNR